MPGARPGRTPANWVFGPSRILAPRQHRERPRRVGARGRYKSRLRVRIRLRKRRPFPKIPDEPNRVGGGVAPLPLSHHRAYLLGTTAVPSFSVAVCETAKACSPVLAANHCDSSRDTVHVPRSPHSPWRAVGYCSAAPLLPLQARRNSKSTPCERRFGPSPCGYYGLG
jgi:hypothetical protein